MRVPVSAFVGASIVTALVVIGPIVVLANLLAEREGKGR